MYWFHLGCAAAMRPEKFLPALEGTAEAVPERDALRRQAEGGITYPRLPRLLRAERAPSGRAHCRLCRELIEKGEWRLALHLFEDGRFAPIGSLHLSCAEAYLGTADLVERLALATPPLSTAELEEVQQGLKTQRPAPEPEAESGEPVNESEPTDNAPGLAKARASRAEETTARRAKS
jgi:hypothetical protein